MRCDSFDIWINQAMPPSVNAPATILKGRKAFSLTELLVAMTIALMVMGSVASLFGVFGRSLSGSQATVEMSSKSRAASWQLRKDLLGVTCDVMPWLAPEADAGYFEYIEGLRSDSTVVVSGSSSPILPGDIEGDTDDVLLFTARAFDQPFVGAAAGGTVEADRAEIAWFCKALTSQPVAGLTMHNLHRRQRLVSAVPGAGAFMATAAITGTNASPWSFRSVSGTSYPNSLGDLTKREHRFLRAATFPFAFLGAASPGASLDGDQAGDDVVLTNVIAFDVRAYDPQSGGYIDLNAGGTGVFAGAPATKSGLAATPTYDTWSTHYEFNGRDDDGKLGVDQGANLVDDSSDGVADDEGEYETSPPYPVPLRGIEVRIRCYEPTSKQIRQITVRHTFVKK
jgi:prepilin-type N-terminal cleavage/methylation domain-containing protein